jgi:DNA-binding GntR family transcriptional regulator
MKVVSLSATRKARAPEVRGPATERRVLREEIRDYLIEDILRGHLAPGDRIVEVRVARRFGVSHAPVREALRDLELLGFIVSLPFRGAVVRQNSSNELLELYPIRAVLEGLAAREAASKITRSRLNQLRRLLVTMQDAATRGDTRAQVAADFRFHSDIVDASQNRMLKQIWEGMRLATTTFLTVLKSRRSMGEIADRHELVLEALEARNGDEAELAMRGHIEEPGRWMHEELAAGEVGQGPVVASTRKAKRSKKANQSKGRA